MVGLVGLGTPYAVIPAKAGISLLFVLQAWKGREIPAFAGMTDNDVAAPYFLNGSWKVAPP